MISPSEPAGAPNPGTPPPYSRALPAPPDALDSFLDSKQPTEASVPRGTIGAQGPLDSFLDSPAAPQEGPEAGGKPKASAWDAWKALGASNAAQIAWKMAWHPTVHLPEAPKDLPNVQIPGFELANPALIGAVYNGFWKPALESASSPAGLAMAVVTPELKALAAVSPMAKAAVMGMGGVFGGIMAKSAKDQYPATKAVLNNPNASLQDKATAVSSEAGEVLMAIMAPLGGLLEMKGSVVTPEELKGVTPTQAADILSAKIAEAPLDQVGPLKEASEKLRDLSTEQSESAKAWDEVKKVLAPTTRSPEAATAAGIMREHGGTLARSTDIAEAALNDASKALMKLPADERWEAVDRIENGEMQPTPALQGFADTTRHLMDTDRDEIQALGAGKLEHFIEDYFPHIWKDPEKAADQFRSAISKAPLEGGKSFLKQRTIPTIKEGMTPEDQGGLGLEPVSPNPVEMVLLRHREMQKYILGQKVMAELKDRELVTSVRPGDEPPPGYTKIDDPIARVYGPRKGAVSFDPTKDNGDLTPGDVTVHGRRLMAEYYAPDPVATILNNYLSPGLRRHALFRMYLSAANSLNQFQLGLSAFHLGFVSLDTSISKLALALEYGAAGRPLKALGEAAQIPAAPFTTAIQGNRVLKEWSKPGSQGAEIARIADAYMKGGGRAKMDQFYQTNMTKRMTEMFAKKTPGGVAGGLWRAPFAALEQVSKPLMSWLVPRMKAGVAADMLKSEFEKLPKNATEDDFRKVADKVVDSVDNRMGQMVYDNLFWHKTAKDLAMASVRSVGWDIGTIRELGGGLKDTASFLKNAASKKEKAEFTHRMAYMVALPTLTGLIGAAYQYLQTGKGPQELRDYHFPKTGEQDPHGRDVRMALPSYMNDMYHYTSKPVQTIEGKVSPFPQLVMQMLNNKDYFGRDIRNADDPLVKQLTDEAKYFGESYAPISIRQFGISQAARQSTSEKVGNFFGVTRAPAWIGETDAEQLAGKLAGEGFKSTKSPDAAVVAEKQAIQVALRNGSDKEKADAQAKLDQMEDAQQITATQRKNIEGGTDRTYLENAITHLSAQDAVRVFKVATKPEREEIFEAVQRHVDRARNLSDDDREKLQGEIDGIVAQDQKKLPPRDINTSLRSP